MTESKKDLKVKGALMVALAMLINGARDINWTAESELTEADLNLIKKGIMSASWYERSLYERMGNAVYKVIGKGQSAGAFEFGKGILAETMLKIYRGPLIANEPFELLPKFAEFWGNTWFNFGKAEFERLDKGGIIRIFDPNGMPFQKGFLAMVRGFFARMVTESHGKNVIVECDEEKLSDSQLITTATLHIHWD